VSLAALNGMLTEAGADIDVPAGVDAGAMQLVSLRERRAWGAGVASIRGIGCGWARGRGWCWWR
jgi:hypothetical protein